MNNKKEIRQQYYQFVALCQEHEQAIYKVVKRKRHYDIVKGELDKFDGSEQLVIDSDYWLAQEETADLATDLVMNSLAIWNIGIVQKYRSATGKFEGKGDFICLENANSEAPTYFVHFNGTTEAFKRNEIFLDVAQYFTPLAVLIVDRTRELHGSVLQFDDLRRDLGL